MTCACTQRGFGRETHCLAERYGLHHASDNWCSCRCHDPVPLEYHEGEWMPAPKDGPEPAAVVTYTREPSPETGHIGWCWWALGKMGDAPSLDEAKRLAEEEIARRVGP